MENSNIKQVILHPKKEESLKRFHPWVFSGAINKLPSGLIEGETVKVISHNGEFLGVGHYQIGSIAVRILSFNDETIDTYFYIKEVESAYKLRQKLNLIRDDNNIYRLIHGEGDHLPGLIVDMYGDVAVVQSHSVGMDTDKDKIIKALQTVIGSDQLKHIYYKSEGTLPYKAEIESIDEYLIGGEDVNHIAIENGMKFNIDWLRGQKTGFFVDQRDNRLLVELYSKDKTVLNMFSYTGGFSVFALRGGAKEVYSVDSSSKAIALSNENIMNNFGEEPRHHSSSEDAFRFLRESPKDKFDLIILDPPAFAKHRGAVRNALQGYKRLNLSAFQIIKPGSILFTFSCSQVITKEQFRLAVFSAAAISGRKVRILHQLTQPSDHPVNIYHPEGEYLKGLVLYVE